MSCPFCCVELLLAVELFPGEPALRAPLVPLFRGLNAPFLGLGLEFRVALEFWRDELFMVDNEWSERFGAILGDSCNKWRFNRMWMNSAVYRHDECPPFNVR